MTPAEYEAASDLLQAEYEEQADRIRRAYYDDPEERMEDLEALGDELDYKMICLDSEFYGPLTLENTSPM